MPLEKEAESARILRLAPPPSEPEPNPDVVEFLTTLLGDAKAGKLRAVAYVALYEKDVSRSWAGIHDANATEAIGSLHIIAHEMAVSFYGEE